MGKRRGNRIKDGGTEWIRVEQISVQLSQRKLIMVIQLVEGTQKEWSYSGRGSHGGLTVLYRNTITWVEADIKNEVTGGRA